MTIRGFLYMILKRSNNRCTGKAQLHQEPKKFHWVPEGQTITRGKNDTNCGICSPQKQSFETVNVKAAHVLKELTQGDFQHCFRQWKIRIWRCRDRGRVTIEEDNK